MACHGTGVLTGQANVWDLPLSYQIAIMQATGTSNPRDAQAAIDGGVSLSVRLNGALRTVGGTAAAGVGVSMSTTGAGALVGVPLAAWGGDQAGTGLKEVLTGQRQISLGGQAVQSAAGKGLGGQILTAAYDTVPGVVAVGVVAFRAPVTLGEARGPAASGCLPARLQSLKPGEPLADGLEIVVRGSNNKPGTFILRQGIDDAPLGVVTQPGKSAAIATDLQLETEIPKMFGRAPVRGDVLSGAFVEDIRAAGFDVVYAPTEANPFHVRILPKTAEFDAAGFDWLSTAFDNLGKVKK